MKQKQQQQLTNNIKQNVNIKRKKQTNKQQQPVNKVGIGLRGKVFETPGSLGPNNNNNSNNKNKNNNTRNNKELCSCCESGKFRNGIC